MKISTKAGAVSAVSTIALALSLTACGSEEEADTVVHATATETSTHTSTVTSGEPSPSESTSAEPTTAGAEPQDPAVAAGAGAAGQGLSNPFDDPNFQVPTHQPLQGGTQGSDADRQQMQDTLYASLNPPSPEKWTRVLLDNSCRKVTDPVRAEMQRSGYTLDQIEQAARMQAEAGQGLDLPHSDVTVSDVKVEGNRASATATVTNQNGSETQTQIFEREDGRWKLCN